MPPERARVVPEACINCGRCLKICVYQAMQPVVKATWVKEENCIGCAGCYSVCPVGGDFYSTKKLAGFVKKGCLH